MPYAIHDNTGKISRIIQCPEEELDAQKAEGELHTEVEHSANTWDTIDLALGKVVPGVSPFKKPKKRAAYAEARVKAYPSPGYQLDMLWHAMDKGNAPKIEPWYGFIKSIKQAIPKVPDPE